MHMNYTQCSFLMCVPYEFQVKATADLALLHSCFAASFIITVTVPLCTRLQLCHCQLNTSITTPNTEPYTDFKLAKHDCDAAQMHLPSPPR